MLVMRRETQVNRRRDNLQPVCLAVDADGWGGAWGLSDASSVWGPPSHISISLQSWPHPIPPPSILVSSTFSHALNSLLTLSLQATKANGHPFVVPQTRLLKERIFLVLFVPREIVHCLFWKLIYPLWKLFLVDFMETTAMNKAPSYPQSSSMGRGCRYTDHGDRGDWRVPRSRGGRGAQGREKPLPWAIREGGLFCCGPVDLSIGQRSPEKQNQ